MAIAGPQGRECAACACPNEARNADDRLAVRNAISGEPQRERCLLGCGAGAMRADSSAPRRRAGGSCVRTFT